MMLRRAWRSGPAQGVEELVEVDRGGRVDLGDRRVVLQLRGVVGARLIET